MPFKTMKLADLRPSPYNPRKQLMPGDPEYDALRASILEFGYADPIVLNTRTGNVVGGHQRRQVLMDMGRIEEEVFLVDLDEMKEKGLNLALNKITGDWDGVKLQALLEEVDTGAINILATGFSQAELEMLLAPVGDKDGVSGAGRAGDEQRPVIQYTLIFDDAQQQAVFYEYLKFLKTAYPDRGTISERLIEDVKLRLQEAGHE